MDKTVLRAALWDLDGTIADTEQLWVTVEQDMVSEAGGQWTQQLAYDLVGATVNGAARLLHQAGVGACVEEVAAELQDRVAVHMGTDLPWRPGALALLADLRAQGVSCVLVTMSPRGLALEAAAQLPADTFAHVVSADDVVMPKPDPEPYFRAMELIGESANTCVAIEDSLVGATAATRAGLATLVIPQIVDVPPAPRRWFRETLVGVTASDLAELLTTEATNPTMNIAGEMTTQPS